MNKIQIVCLIMALIEAYHFFFHNTVRAECQPFYDRIKFCNNYRKIFYSYYYIKNFAEKHPSNRLIRRFMEEYDLELSNLNNALGAVPTANQLMIKLVTRTSTRVIRMAIITTSIEVFYFCIFVYLLYLLPNNTAWLIGISMLAISAMHSINEYREQMLCKWYPFADSAFCIAVYMALFFSF